MGDARVLFRNPAFALLVREFFAGPTVSDQEKMLRTWMRLVQEGYNYDQVCLLDSQGVVRLSVPGIDEPLSPVLKRKAVEALESRQITFVDFFRQEHSRKISLALLVPILDGQEGGRPLGLLSLRINPEAYLYPFIQRWPSPSKTGETLLVRREGNDAVFLNELRFQKNTALTLRIPLGRQDVPAVKAILGWKGLVEGRDYRGVPVLASVRAVSGSPWFLVARMDAAEVYGPMRKTDGTLVLVVRDNGRGFEVEKALTKENTERGLGLASMRERTELSGGTFSIESAPGKGTVVQVTWPEKKAVRAGTVMDSSAVHHQPEPE